MSVTPVTAKYDGKVLVPEAPLDAKPGDVFDVAPRAPAMAQEEWLTFLNSVEGSWIGTDMEDPCDPPITGRPKTLEEWKEFVRRTAGAWADFDEYEDPEELPYEPKESRD